MNRKDRRAAQKQARAAPSRALNQGLSPGAVSGNLFSAAVQHFRAGQLDAAERACRDVLTFDRKHADALHLLGMIAFQAGRPDTAVELFGRALDLKQNRDPDCHFNLAQALQSLGRLQEAAHAFTQATVLRPDSAVAFLQLAEVRRQQGRSSDARAAYARAAALSPDLAPAHFGLGYLALLESSLIEAESGFRRAIALKPDDAEASANLAVTLAGQGRIDEAIAQYQHALNLKPDMVALRRSLGRLFLERGETLAALEQAWRGVTAQETEESKAFFGKCMRNLPSLPPEGWLRDDIIRLLIRALTEGWTRPAELAATAASMFRLRDAAKTCVQQVASAWPARLAASDLHTIDGLALVASDPLLLALLESAPVMDIELERFLTRVRGALLDQALAADASTPADDGLLRFFCALARQCFINEYLFAQSEGEARQVAQLRDRFDAALASGAAVDVLWPVGLAAYVPLHSTSSAEAMLRREWPAPLAALLEQQVRQPLTEWHLRAAIPTLTSIDDEVSQKVQRQYEEMPYPRWLQNAPISQPTAIDWYLRNQFPLAPLQNLGPKSPLEVLIAGCGTGQHAIETSQLFTGARLLAVDLSLASLGYAKRKTEEFGISNINYAQADILKLGASGRSFDVIEAVGVLHHLRDPEEGWRVLLSLLRPGGLMHIGLYSATARADVRAVRDYIAERGYGQNAGDIRRCRQELIEAPAGTLLNDVCSYADFYAMSGCCDLLFHVQEHQFTLPRIKTFLDENDLTLIGFTNDVAQHYRMRFPDDRAATDLESWQLFEAEQPKTFAGMYQFWLQKAGAPTAR